jgi:hypothetical protein
MKQKALDRQLAQIARKIERKQIVKKAMTIAEKYGVCKSEMHSAHTKCQENYSGKDYMGIDFGIEHTSGWSMFGGEDLKIFYERQRVFYASTTPVYQNFGTSGAIKKDNQIKLGELYLHQYTPGQWERQLNLIYKNGPKKEKPKVVKPEEREVDKSKLEELAERLPIKL